MTTSCGNMYKFSPKVANVPNGPIGSPSPSPSLGLLDLYIKRYE